MNPYEMVSLLEPALIRKVEITVTAVVDMAQPTQISSLGSFSAISTRFKTCSINLSFVIYMILLQSIVSAVDNFDRSH